MLPIPRQDQIGSAALTGKNIAQGVRAKEVMSPSSSGNKTEPLALREGFAREEHAALNSNLKGS